MPSTWSSPLTLRPLRFWWLYCTSSAAFSVEGCGAISQLHAPASAMHARAAARAMPGSTFRKVAIHATAAMASMATPSSAGVRQHMRASKMPAANPRAPSSIGAEKYRREILRATMATGCCSGIARVAMLPAVLPRRPPYLFERQLGNRLHMKCLRKHIQQVQRAEAVPGL